ncbi:MAG: right-handed parallel beta-helix repeat-containing protein [Chloroflexi bacterium]|nr:right-handed parallel beta-helix repeat-containing protein [Chloroflexota bacterium]
MKRALLIFLLLAVFLVPSRSARAAEPRCANTFIASPAPHSTIGGVAVITGRAQLEGAFVRYQVDFSTTGLNLWVLLNSAPQAIVDGTLARWDTTLIPDGAYDLRVRTIDTSGNYCEFVTQSVFVRQSEQLSVISHQLSVSSNQSPVTSDQLPVSSLRSPISNQPVSISHVIEIESLNGKLTVAVPQAPSLPYCTPSYMLGSIVTRSVRLCAGQTYRPFTLVGDNLAVIGDPSPSSGQAQSPAVIRSYGRVYGIRATGNNVLIAGVNVVGVTAPNDLGNWLCLYAQCRYASPPIQGGAAYGGGILLEGSNSTVMNSAISGGVIGIALLYGRGNKILNNQISNLTGWGIFAASPTNSAFVGNTLHDINRACTDPSGNYYAGGCESAGMLLMGADTNLIANNTCARSGNCFYLNGEGGRSNNFNKLYGNLCSAPSFNCSVRTANQEITDARAVEFDNNSATLSPGNASGCEIWLVRAQIIAGKNNRVPPCNHRGSHVESTYDPPK